jgi:ketosteroid isomerase-like protein
MSSEEQEQAVRAYYAASDASDGVAVGALLTDDVRWWVPQTAAAQGLPRPVVGRQQLIDAFWGTVRYRPGTRSWTIERLITGGDCVAAQATLTATMAAGAPYVNQYVYVFRFEGSKIAEVWEYLDTAYFFQQKEEGEKRLLT